MSRVYRVLKRWILVHYLNADPPSLMTTSFLELREGVVITDCFASEEGTTGTFIANFYPEVQLRNVIAWIIRFCWPKSTYGGELSKEKNICGFVAICYSFLHEIWDHWHLWWHLWAIWESFLLQKFAAKVSRYMHGSWNIIGWKGWTITTVLYSYNLTRTVTFGRVSEVSNTRRVTSGGVWNVDPWLLWLFNCCHKEKGSWYVRKCQEFAMLCSPGLLPLWSTWQLVFVECGRSLNDSFGCVHFVSSPGDQTFPVNEYSLY